MNSVQEFRAIDDRRSLRTSAGHLPSACRQHPHSHRCTGIGALPSAPDEGICRRQPPYVSGFRRCRRCCSGGLRPPLASEPSELDRRCRDRPRRRASGRGRAGHSRRTNRVETSPGRALPSARQRSTRQLHRFVRCSGLRRRQTDSAGVAPGETVTLDFALSPAPVQLDEIVTTATGRAEPAEIGNADLDIEAAEDRQEAPITEFGDVLAGRAAGSRLQEQRRHGHRHPIRIRIRRRSLSNEPLYYVEGVRIDATPDGYASISVGRVDTPASTTSIPRISRTSKS